MFENTLILDAGRQKPWTVFAGLSGQLLALGTAALIPLVYTDQLPLFRFSELHIMAPISRALPIGDSVKVKAQRQPVTRNVFIAPGKLYAPRQTPKGIADIQDNLTLPDTPAGMEIPGALPDNHPPAIGILARAGMAAAPPAELRTPALEKPRVPDAPPVRIKIGGAVQEARILNRVLPAYPALARQARISGVVHLLGIIGKDGRVQQLQVVSGHPLLIGAALDAVRQWTYRPTLLNGDPVEVVAPIEVRFTLAQ